MYELMSSWKSSQAFKHSAVLTNKSSQETRWARAELRSIQTLLRNIPTFEHIYAVEDEICRNNLDMRGQKEAKRMQEMVSDPEFLKFWYTRKSMPNFRKLFSVLLRCSKCKITPIFCSYSYGKFENITQRFGKQLEMVKSKSQAGWYRKS